MRAMRFDPANPGESEVFSVDFAEQLLEGETIDSTTWAIEVVNGVDADVASRLEGLPTVEGTKSCQRITGLLRGVDYRGAATAITSLGNRLKGWALIPTNDIGV